MSQSPLDTPVRVDGIVSEERLAELLALETEYSELDFKVVIDLSSKEGLVELAKDVGAMQVKGGYILGGVDGGGKLTGRHNGADTSPFDEANLTPKLLRYLSEPLGLSTSIIEHKEHTVVTIFVQPNPYGCAFFKIDGVCGKRGNEVTVFRAGEVFWRDGTRSVRITREGLEEVIARRVAAQRSGWLDEQAEIRRHDQAELEDALQDRRRAEAALGSVNFGLATQDVTISALEMVRADDSIGLQHLLNDAPARARPLIEADDIEEALGDLLDKLTCLAATFLEYEQQEWFQRTVRVLAEIYALGFAGHHPNRFGYANRIPPTETGPRVWLAIIERIYALGSLAVRQGQWSDVRTLTLQLPRPLAEDGYYTNWLRHALTMANRAQHFDQAGATSVVSLLNLARADVARLACLRPDGLQPDDDALSTDLAQFDVLSNIVAVIDADSTESKVFYTNFARFNQARVQPIVESLISDPTMRKALLTPKQGDAAKDGELALALAAIGSSAETQGALYDGFRGWGGTPVAQFIEETSCVNPPAQIILLI